MPPWVTSALDVLQLFVNVGALVGGAIIWKLYVDNLKASLTSKDAEISSVEKNRDMWRDQAEALEKRTPEAMERILSERIQTRESEIVRLNEDKERNAEALQLLEREKSNLASDLSRTRGFRLMLALEGEGTDGELEDTTSDVMFMPQPDDIQVVLLGEVGVDSGQLMVTDPCYVDSEWQHESRSDDENEARTVSDGLNSATELTSRAPGSPRLPAYSYEGAMEATASKGYGELAYKLGHAGAGVVFYTAWGDGVYPIYGELHDGRINRAYINVG